MRLRPPEFDKLSAYVPKLGFLVPYVSWLRLLKLDINLINLESLNLLMASINRRKDYSKQNLFNG